MGSTLLYQSLAEPTPRAASLPETAQVDKWYVVPTPPPRQPARVSSLQPTYAVDAKLLTLHERIDLDKWYRQPVDPPAPLKRLTDRPAEPSIDTKQLTLHEAITLDKWYVVPVPPPRQNPRLTDRDAGAQLFWANFAVAFNPSAGFPWPEPEPPPRQRQRVSSLQPTYAIDAKQLTLHEAITLDKWYTAPVPPPRPPGRLSWVDVFVSVNLSSLSTRFRSYVDIGALQRRDGAAPAPGTSYVDIGAAQRPESTTAAFDPASGFPWPAPESPPRALRRLTDRDAGAQIFWANFAAAFNPSAGFPWQEVEPPPRQLKRLTDAHAYDADTKALTLKESVTSDRWQPRQPDPPRPRPRVAGFAPDVAFVRVVAAPILADSWSPAQSDPTRFRSKNPTWLGAFAVEVGVFVTEATTLDRWYRQTVDPPRPARRLTDPITMPYVFATGGAPPAGVPGPYYLLVAGLYAAGGTGGLYAAGGTGGIEGM